MTIWSLLFASDKYKWNIRYRCKGSMVQMKSYWYKTICGISQCDIISQPGIYATVYFVYVVSFYVETKVRISHAIDDFHLDYCLFLTLSYWVLSWLFACFGVELLLAIVMCEKYFTACLPFLPRYARLVINNHPGLKTGGRWNILVLFACCIFLMVQCVVCPENSLVADAASQPEASKQVSSSNLCIASETFVSTRMHCCYLTDQNA